MLGRADLSVEIKDDELYRIIDDVILEKCRYKSVKERVMLRKKLFDSIRGLDVLQNIIDDDDVTDGTRKIEIPLYSVEWLKMGLSTTSIFLRIPGRVANKYQFISF